MIKTTLFLALLLSSQIHAADQRTEVSNSATGGQVVRLPPQGNVIVLNKVDKDGSSLFVAMGDPAVNITAGDPVDLLRANPPVPPNMIKIKAGKKMIGGMTELSPFSRIYISALHVLASLELSDLEASFAAANLNLSDFVFLRADHLDVVVAMPTSLSNAMPGLLSQMAPSPRSVKGYSFFSYGYGYVPGHSSEHQTIGNVDRIAGGLFYLPKSWISSGSSGSLIYVTPALKNNADLPSWSLGGVVECMLLDQTLNNGVEIQGGVQVISMKTLESVTWSPISAEAFSNLVVPEIPGCPPIGGRGGGMLLPDDGD